MGTQGNWFTRLPLIKATAFTLGLFSIFNPRSGEARSFVGTSSSDTSISHDFFPAQEKPLTDIQKKLRTALVKADSLHQQAEIKKGFGHDGLAIAQLLEQAVNELTILQIHSEELDFFLFRHAGFFAGVSQFGAFLTRLEESYSALDGNITDQKRTQFNEKIDLVRESVLSATKTQYQNPVP